jgi:hypothetical protein
MQKGLRATAVGLVVGATVMGNATSVMAQGRPVTLTVAVYDYAGVSTAALARAKAETTRIFRAIDIEVVWADRSSASSTFVNILSGEMSRKLNIPWGVKGQAVSGTRLVRVFYRHLDRIGGSNDQDRGRLVGHVIAHEIGHTLLPPDSHSDTGIMSADLTMQHIAKGLSFTPEQGVLIRSRLVSRTLSQLAASQSQPPALGQPEGSAQ